MLRKFTKQLGFDDVEGFYAKLIALEAKRADDPPELTATNIMNKLKGLPLEGEEEPEEILSAEAEMLRLLRAQHLKVFKRALLKESRVQESPAIIHLFLFTPLFLQIMEQAALGYFRSAEYAAWLSAHPSPRVGMSFGKVYMRKEIRGGKWDDKPKITIFDPPPNQGM